MSKIGRTFNPYKQFVGSWIPNWLLARSEISAGAKLVYARLCQYAGVDGKAFPKVETLGYETGYGKRQTQRYVRELEEAGLIRTVDRSAKGLPNLYRFVWHEWVEEALFPVENTGCQISHPPPVTSDIPPVSDLSPLKENQLRESEEEIQHSPSVNGGPGGPPANASDLKGPGDELDQRESSAPTDLENSSESGTLEDRLERVRVAGEGGSAKAVEQAKANALKRRERLMRRDSQDQQRKENLKGRPPSADLRRLEKVWRSEMEAAYPDTVIVKWGGKDRGQVTKMIEDCGSSHVVENALRYVVRNWKTLRERFFKGKGNGVPSVGFVLSLRATLVPEAEIWSKHAAILEEWERVKREIDDPFAYPEDLRARVAAAREELAEIGLG